MPPLKISNVAIIGAGPAGLAAAKYLLAEKSFNTIRIFEQRSVVGGVWNYTPNNEPDETFGIPQTSPKGKVEKPVWLKSGSKGGWKVDTVNGVTPESRHDNVPMFIAPIYETLETNIPHTLMQYSDKPFSKDTQLFPRHETVLQYLEEYADDIRHLIHFDTQVLNIALVPATSQHTHDQWSITVRNVKTKQQMTNVFDAVVVANGHYNLPYIPDIHGIKNWNRSLPGSISHSKYFRRPDEFAGKKVIIVGNSASGIDIGSQIATVCKGSLIISSRSESYLTPATPMSNKLDLPTISALDPNGRTVIFSNGHIESDVDSIVFCTGYFYSYPFLHGSIQPPLIEDGTHVVNTYQHLIYRQHPTLALLALPQRVIPFQVSEVQSAFLARIYSGRLELPSQDEMKRWEEAVRSKQGDGGEFHVLHFPKDAEYINILHDWSAKAESRAGLENDGAGKIPPRWNEWEKWCRPRFPEMRKAFGAQGDKRRNITTLDQIGFHFELDGDR
ncbi:flavin-containing monooxygenase family protein [Pseudovirgaria hyperparasitica]|uniref:Flavin-containing monooxygenase family protein n=1 Tax=Pseudovirgaria hyperparasitica TaxID=470096 RepID=A0A6A6VYN8_9PEZI|nr:flavin-containing monooxygenase family protein [Pseudovirgaria hyperparasitica]KAF2754790.1 flavin-containing monooxygenase family protein [Pseudovirgaria hyperparasitica]